MKHGMQLTAKIIGFAVAVIWAFGLVMVGIGIFKPFMDAVATNLVSGGPLYGFAEGWFWFTIAVLGAGGAYLGFRFIGKWEKI